MKARLLLILLLLLPWVAPAQSVIKTESFESDGEGVSGRYTSNTFNGGTSGTTAVRANQYFLLAAASSPPTNWSINPVSGGTLDGSFFWASEGARGPASTFDRSPGTVTLDPATVTGYSSLKVRVAFMDARGGLDNWEFNDTVKVQVRFNGTTAWTTVGQFAGSSQSTQGKLQQDFNLNGKGYDETVTEVLTTTMKDYEFAVTGTGTTLQVRVRVSQDGVQEELGFDNIRIVGTPATSAAPVLGGIEDTALSYAEGDPAKTLTSTLTLTDADSPNLGGATVTLTNPGYVNGQDLLAFTNQNGITGTWDAAAGTLTLGGASSVANYLMALKSITYQNTNTTNATAGNRTVSFSVKDQANVSSNTVSRVIAVTSALLGASSIPYSEDFETDGEGTRYASNTFNAVNGLAFLRTNLNPFNSGAATFTGVSNAFRWDGSGTNTASNPDTRRIGILETRQVDATSYTGLHFLVKMGARQNEWESTDYLKLYYRTGGSAGTWTIFASFRGDALDNGQLRRDANPINLTSLPTGTTLTTTLTNFDFALPAAVNGQQVDFRFELSTNDSREEAAWDLIQVTGTLIAPPTVTTTAAGTIATTSAVLGGNVTADGGVTVTGRGVLYSVSNATPTVGGTDVTQDANGTGVGTFSKTITGLTAGTTYYVRAYATNSAGTSYGTVATFTTTPNAPTVSVPADGTRTNTTTPTYSGTAQAGATVTVYVDGANIGTATATSAGTWARAQPSPLTEGSHTVYATAGIGFSATSANSATNNFTIDTVAPTVAISSTAGTSGSTTNTTPIPFTVNFSENVTGFSASGVSVTNGAVSGFTPVNGSTYTFNVTPNTPGTATTVNVAAGVAQDNATNANTAASAAYSLIYQLPNTTVVSVTRLTPSPTATTQVSYRVIFAASVTGVSTNNFSLSNHGTISGASVSNVSGSGTTWTVTVNTGSGNGAIRLDVLNSTGISPTVTNVPYTSGEVYTITKSFAAQPQLTIQGSGGSGGDVTAFVDVVQVLSGGTAFANGLQNGSFETHGALANGNYGYNPSNVEASWTFNAQSGIAEGGSAFSPVTPIPNGIAVAFVQGNGQLQQNLAVPTGGNYQVSFQASQRNCCSSQYDQALNVLLNGVFLGTIQPANDNSYLSFTSAPFAVTAPALTASITSPAGANNSTTDTAPIPFTVTFTQAVTGFDASDVTVGNGTVTGSNISGSGTTYTFDVTPSGNGLVTVNVPANGAVDANNTGNTAATGFNITYSQPVTVVPVVTAPANGSLANNPTPTYSGTAPDGSTVTVYVDNGSIGTTTAMGGSFSLTQPTVLGQGAHTVYATAQTPGSTVSPKSNTNTFTVDTTRPTVVLTSSTGASGTATVTSPFAFTANFTEPVTGFVAGDLLVTNGTVSSFAGSGTTYTFNVTPTTPGTATTVTVFGNSSQDAANNGNSASNTYALTFAPTSVTWNGSVSTDWYTAGNWTPALVPTTTLNATIPAAAPLMPLIATGTASVRHLTINAEATLDQTGGTLTVAGNLTTNGTFTPTGGTTVLGSTALTNLLGSSRIRFWNLTVNSNTAQVSTSAGASVRRLLTLTGNLSTNGNDFVLESDATSTAMVVNSGGSVVGTATVQRYIDPSLNPGLGYRHYSSPVQSTTVADLATSGFSPVVNSAYNTLGSKASPFPTVYGYDEARIVGTSATTRSQNYGYFSPASLNTPLERGRGYTVNLRASEKVDLVGTLNTGTVAVGALSRGPQANSGWHLLGNPYPAPLDWTRVRPDLPDGVRDAVYVFKSSDQYNGTYQFFANGFGTLPGGLVPSMQGFFVRVTQAVPAFSFLSTWRATTYSNPTFQRTAADTRPALQLELVSAKGVHEPTFVYFEAGATAEVDNHYDAEKLLNTTGLNLSSVAAGTNLAINGLPPTAEATIVPLTVQVPAAGTYALRAAELHNLAGQAVYLHDAVTGQQVDLQQQSAYSFSTSGAAQLTGRFSLHFGALVPTGSAAAALAAQVSLYPNPASSTVTLLAPRQLVGKTSQVQVLNSLGQVVRRQAVATTATGLRTELSLQGLAQGVYTVRLETNGVVVTKRLVIH